MAPQLAEAFPPGDFLAEELEARHWSQGDFALILGRPAQFVSEIVSGKKEITRESAAQIGAALGTGPEYWLNLQNAFFLWKHSQDTNSSRELDDVRLRARMNELAPVALLRKRGILRGETLPQQAEELVSLFQIKDIRDDPTFLAAARRLNADEDPTPTQKAWLACARKEAQGLSVAPYDAEKLESLGNRLSQYVSDPADFANLPEKFAGAGVRLVYVQAFPGSKLKGATFLLDGDPQKPVVALSGHGKRLDGVLFTLLHEIAHLVLGHVSPERFYIDEDDSETPNERAADELAGQWQIPGELSKPPSVIRSGWVREEADRLGVNPIVVLGRLQNDKVVDWRTILAKGAPTVTAQLESWNQGTAE